MEKFGETNSVMNNLTEEEWECVRVCVNNAPIPYDIRNILEKIGKPIENREGGIPKVKYDLTPYGISEDE